MVNSEFMVLIKVPGLPQQCVQVQVLFVISMSSHTNYSTLTSGHFVHRIHMQSHKYAAENTKPSLP